MPLRIFAADDVDGQVKSLTLDVDIAGDISIVYDEIINNMKLAIGTPDVEMSGQVLTFDEYGFLLSNTADFLSDLGRVAWSMHTVRHQFTQFRSLGEILTSCGSKCGAWTSRSLASRGRSLLLL
jgi:hypothetical protein